MPAEQAWLKCGKPTTPGNIQRRAGAIRKADAARQLLLLGAQSSNPSKPATRSGGKPAASQTSTRTGKPAAKATKRPTRMVEADVDNMETFWHSYATAHQAATREYILAYSTGKSQLRGFRASDIAKKYDDTLSPDNPNHITVSALMSWRKKGKEGGAMPKKPGPAVKPDKAALVMAAKAFAKVDQSVGQAPKPKELVAKAMSSIQGTGSEGLLSTPAKKKHFKRALRHGADRLSSGKGESIDTRRVDVLTEENVTAWFTGWIRFTMNKQFSVNRRDDTGVLRPYISKQKRARIIQPDEFDLVMSTEMDSGGPRANVYFDKALGAAVRRKVVNARHTTGQLATNGAREVLPPYFEFDSLSADAPKAGRASHSANVTRASAAATTEEDLSGRVHPSWFIGLPRVTGRFGHSTDVSLPSGWEVSAKGGTIKGSFIRWIEKSVDPAYPNIQAEWEYASDGSEDSVGDMPIKAGPVIIKTDNGPDRMDTDEEELLKRKKLHHAGYLFYPGLPNGSAANQEQDQIYDDLRAGTTEQAERIVAEKEKIASRARKAFPPVKVPPVNLTNEDLPRMLMGKRDAAGKCTDPEEKRPFTWSFAKERVDAGWNRIGAVGKDGYITAASINHPKVRPSVVEKDASDDDDPLLDVRVSSLPTGTKTAAVKRARSLYESAMEALGCVAHPTPTVTRTVQL